MARVYMQSQPAKKGVVRGTKVSLYLTCDDNLIDSLSKISDKNMAYYQQQLKLLEAEAEEQARHEEEAEAKALEEEQQRNAEAEERLLGVETVDGATQILGGEAEAKAVAEAEKQSATVVLTDDDIIEE